MSMHIQVSLQFDNADLFDNFITPYRSARLLNSLIIKCLSAYYYNEDARGLIKHFKLDKETEKQISDYNKDTEIHSMRAQISLQFADADLFENLVILYRERYQLSIFIIQCLTAYYYSENIRNTIEGISMSDATNGEEVQSTQSIVDNIRKSLVMQDYLAAELQSTIDNGTEDIDNILFSTEEKELIRKQKVKEAEKQDELDSKYSILLQSIVDLARCQGNTEVFEILSNLGVEVQASLPSQPEISQATENKVKSTLKELENIIFTLQSREKLLQSALDNAKREKLVLKEQKNLAEAKAFDCESTLDNLEKLYLDSVTKIQALQSELKAKDTIKSIDRKTNAFDNAVIVSNRHAEEVQSLAKQLSDCILKMLQSGF